MNPLAAFTREGTLLEAASQAYPATIVIASNSYSLRDLDFVSADVTILSGNIDKGVRRIRCKHVDVLNGVTTPDRWLC